MNRFATKTLVTVLVLALLVSTSFGQKREETEDVEEGQDTEKVFQKMEVGSNWLYGQTYVVGDKRLKEGAAKELIRSIGDPEASSHVHRSTLYSYGTLGAFVLGLGLTLTAVSDKEEEVNKTMLWSGVGVMGASGLMGMQMKEEMRRGVDRYNTVVEEKYGSFFQRDPASGRLVVTLGVSLRIGDRPFDCAQGGH